MKNLLPLILTVALLLCLASCQKPAQTPETNTTPAQTTTEAPTETTAPEHTEHTGSWISVEVGHFYQFTCGGPSAAEIELHRDGDGDQICDVCGYEMAAKTCTQPFEWVGFEEGHAMRMLCDCCDAPDVIEPHEDKNGDLVCDFCNYEMPARDSYSLTMNNPKWLYEELKPTYYVGEIVSVKIGIVTDTGFLFFVNGEEITDYKDDSGIYWEFTFQMPACDTYVHFKTYDGFLPDVNYGTLIETYYRQNLDARYVHVRHYYGEFASGAIVAMIDAGGYGEYLWQEKIGDTVIQYYDGNRITVLYENVFYTLTEAYENGCLTLEEIQIIANMHNNGLC